MVLYGYDASVFNAAQGSDNWLEWFNLDRKRDVNLIGLINVSKGPNMLRLVLGCAPVPREPP